MKQQCEEEQQQQGGPISIKGAFEKAINIAGYTSLKQYKSSLSNVIVKDKN